MGPRLLTDKRARRERRRRGIAGTWLLVAVVAALLAVVSGAEGETEVERMARELASLRVELDSVDAALRAERARALGERRALETRRATLDGELDLERVRQDTANARIASFQGKLSARGDSGATFRPVLESALGDLRQAVEESLPFRRAQRLTSLEELGAELRAERLDAETAAARLWQFVEDELQLASEVVRTKVPLELEEAKGPRRLVDAVRIGMVALYVRNEGGGFSHVVRREGGWRLEPIVEQASAREIARLFENVGKRVVEGQYDLPLPSARKGEP